MKYRNEELSFQFKDVIFFFLKWMRNQESMTEEYVLSEVFCVAFLGLPQAAACDSERCPDIHFTDKIKDKKKFKWNIFFYMQEVFCFLVASIHSFEVYCLPDAKK